MSFDIIAIVLIDSDKSSSASLLNLLAIALTYGQWLHIKTTTVPSLPLASSNDTKLLSYTLIFFTIFFIFYILAINFKPEVLQKFPNLKNIYESLELVSEIVKSYIAYFKELLSEQFNNL